ncbi:FecR family protein [Mucilaginibacter sp. SG564]|uniref:FecR family protein n=1 Tax=Mucilaginibacter sp. SG564 TaxID=2587022 RepID=UPI0015525345|nr:FecR family protein [Mucilaginibacter sp. SG564]NOW95045.1 hypothetical protein [Mucilaginibacter sp. SG564]
MNKDRISYLFQRYFDDEATESELDDLQMMLRDPDQIGVIQDVLQNVYDQISPKQFDVAVNEQTKENIFQYIVSQPQIRASNNKLWIRLAAAASIVIGLTIGYFHLRPGQLTSDTPDKIAKNDIAPGSNKAILTLSNGRRIILSDAGTGEIAREESTAINKDSTGKIVYVVAAAGNQVPDLMNTISTPRGGQYQVVLPDGTHAWLNAASSLRYPAVFTGPNRVVELTGEAYFEVVKDMSHPFHVITATQTVEVLGTHFNVNSYADEPSVKTTLLEGSVKVIHGSATAKLKPAEQSAVNDKVDAEIQVNHSVDTDDVIAWKEGKFRFDQTDMPALMRQLSRWYDVDVVYQGKVPVDRFSGTLSRNVNISKVLKLLEFTGVKFKIEGRKLIIK